MFKIWLILKYNRYCVAGIILPMVGIRNFIFGFTISFFTIAVCEGICSTEPQNNVSKPPQDITINLFKSSNTIGYSNPTSGVFADIQKESLPLTKNIVADNSISPDGPEDDEILGINIDDDIPIEFSYNSIKDSERIDSANLDDEKVASLPGELLQDTSPWVTVRGAPNIKNKNLLDEINKRADSNLFTQDTSSFAHENTSSSYMVAEKIKQSLIFPIPDEILNDEDLTPTFIKPSAKKKKDKIETQSPKTQNMEIIDKVSHKSEEKESEGGILDSISSWFSEKNQPSKLTSTNKVKRQSPSYSSQDKKETKPDSSSDLASFYESLQKTKQDYNKKSLTPHELKLTFQPDRAEISGSTLKWLKTFSQATIQNNTGLEIRLDISASEELQKKRLNLLYTILSNNGVDIEKVQTFFVSTAPNTFIIRRITIR